MNWTIVSETYQQPRFWKMAYEPTANTDGFMDQLPLQQKQQASWPIRAQQTLTTTNSCDES